jgi:hypothetical protein
MATTATNKQPLLVDRVLHYAIQSNSLTSGSATSLNIEGTNESTVLVDATANDGAIVEDLYVISRTASSVAYKVLFYLSTAIDYLRPSDAVYIGQVESSTTQGEVTSSPSLPRILAPMPHTGDEAQFRALYIPKGRVLWCTLQSAGPVNTSDTPIVGVQGGFF